MNNFVKHEFRLQLSRMWKSWNEPPEEFECFLNEQFENWKDDLVSGINYFVDLRKNWCHRVEEDIIKPNGDNLSPTDR